MTVWKNIMTILLLMPAGLQAQQKPFPKAVNLHGADSLQVSLEMNTYMKEVGELEQQYDKARLLAATKMFESNMNEDTMACYESQAARAFVQLLEGQKAFARKHPKMLIASDLSLRLMDGTDPATGFFRYTSSELEELRHIGQQCADTARQNAIARKYAISSRYAKGMDYRNVELTDTALCAVSLKDFIEPGKPCLLDFWASWCGPCKRAVPHVRQLWQRYAGKFNVISISTDSKETAWRKAMEEQVMPWVQLWAKDGEQQTAMVKAYAVQTLPHLVLIDGDGRIQLVTYSDAVIEQWLSEHLTPSQFVLDCQLPGLAVGTEVTLKSQERLPKDLKENINVKTTVTEDGRVSIEAPVSAPTICQLSIGQKAVMLMVEPRPMTLKAEHVDSLPGFMRFPIDHSRNARLQVTGGLGENEYRVYEDFLLTTELKATEAWMKWSQAFERHADKSELDRLQQQMESANAEVDKAKKAYMQSFPYSTVTGYLLSQKLQEPFAYTSVQLDSVARVVSRMWDADRINLLDTLISRAKGHTSSQHYTDFALCTLKGEGEVKRLSDYLVPGHFTFIDFWASWCGPCRQSIPKVRKLWQQYKGSVDVLSISVDRDEKAWRKAMEQEQMEWTQLWMTQQQMPVVRTAYQLQSIPYLLLITPDGNIAYAGHSVTEAVEVLGRFE